MERRPVSQRRYRLDLSEDEILELQVEDALRATPEERMAAAVALLETVYQLWASRGLAEGQGFCRAPGRARGLFQGLQIDLLLTQNPLFDKVRREYSNSPSIRRARDPVRNGGGSSDSEAGQG